MASQWGKREIKGHNYFIFKFFAVVFFSYKGTKSLTSKMEPLAGNLSYALPSKYFKTEL